MGSNHITNSNKSKSNSPMKIENLESVQSLNMSSSRSKSPRKNQSSSLVKSPVVVESVDRNKTKSPSSIENVTVTNTSPDQFDNKNKKMTSSLSPVNLGTNPTVVISNSISTLHTNASNDKQRHHTPSKKNKNNRKKSNRKVAIASTSNEIDTDNNKIFQDDSTICTSTNDKEGHNINPIDGMMANPNMNDDNKQNKFVDDDNNSMNQQTHQYPQQKQQQSKWYKGNNRKLYYKSPRRHQRQQEQQRKRDLGNAVQQRDVSNSKAHVEDEDKRNASSPVNMIPKTITSSDVNTIIETPHLSDEREVGPHHDNSIKHTYHGSYVESRNQTHLTSDKYEHYNHYLNKADYDDSITSDNIVLSRTAKFKENNQESSENAFDRESALVHEHVLSEEHEHLRPGSRPTSPSSSTGNLVTTNAAGKALLKRLSVDVVSPDGACTASTIGTTNDIDPDNDTSTELSGDVSRIDLNIEQDQEQQAIFTYTNPITFQPTPHPIPPNFDASVQQQQWMIPSPQPDFLHQQDYSNMQYTVPMNNVAAQMGIENEMLYSYPVLMPQVYGQGIPMAPRMNFSNVYQPQLQPSSYIAPMPVKYEQVIVGGCVFFNPVYDFPGEYGVNNYDGRSVGSTNSVSAHNFSTKHKEGTANDVEIDEETNKARHPKKTQNNQKQTGKSRRFKKRYSPKKNTKGEEKGIK